MQLSSRQAQAIIVAMGLPLAMYRVFTARRYVGNIAAVVDGQGLSSKRLELIAAQLQAPETVAVVASGDQLHLRFSTSLGRIAHCGHAMLAATAGCVLAPGNSATKSSVWGGTYRVGKYTGRCSASVVPHTGVPTADVSVVWPTRPRAAGALRTDEVLSPLGLRQSHIDTTLPLCIYDSGNRNALVPIKTVAALEHITPDWAQLKQLCDRLCLIDVHLYTVVRSGRAGIVQVRSRNVFPYGVLEEPATGTASVSLAAALVDGGTLPQSESSPTRFNFDQGLGRRRGQLRVYWSAEGDADRDKFFLNGRVTLMLSGQLSGFPVGGKGRR